MASRILQGITDPHVSATPVKNLRIRFWGVRGSTQFFPTPLEVEEFSRRISVEAVRRVIEDLRKRSASGARIDKVLAGMETPEAYDAYQQQLGHVHMPVYGGDTTCLEVETAEGNHIILDGGSGVRHCAKRLVRNWPAGKPRDVYLLGSHEHLDHRSGLPFSRICFHRPEAFNLHVYGTFGFLNALDERYGVFSRKIRPTTYMDDPIDYRMMSATFHGTEIRNIDDCDAATLGEDLPWSVQDVREPIHIGSTIITAFNVYHGPTRCLAYKFQHNGVSFLFCTDHELRHGQDPEDPRQTRSLAAEERLIHHAADVDACYIDGQYYLSEYMGKRGIGTSNAVPRMDWGHGCIEDIIERARRCRVKRTYIGHHDPEREWPEQVDIDQVLAEMCREWPFKVELAKGDQVVDL